MPERKDHVINDASDFPTSAIARWDANIAAIRLSKELEAGNRDATPEERAVLARYSGFGDSAFRQGLQHAWDEPWKRRKQELKELVTPEELQGIRQSHNTAFYTTPQVVRSMWDTLSGLGAKKLERPRVLEPSAGSGRFLGLQPAGMAEKSERTAVEIDPMTANILKHTYPETRVYNAGFQEAPLPDDHYDIVISNVPFGDTRVYDKDYNATGRKYLTDRIHNYFFAKGLDKARPGGVVAFITSAGTMNAPSSEQVRRYLAERADFMGAVRLPDDAFPDTQVVTDIIYLRKREEGDDSPIDDSWVESEPIEVPDRYGRKHDQSINRYFIDNPDKVLGKHSLEGSMYESGSYTVRSDPARPLSVALLKESREIVRKNPPIRASQEPGDRPTAKDAKKPTGVPAPPKYLLEDGDLRVSRGGSLSDDHGLSKKDSERITDLLKLRNTARRLVNQESADTDSATVEATRDALGEQYQEYVETHGEAINTPANRKILGNDTDDHLLFALEYFDRDSDCWQASDIMHRRVIGAVPVQDVNTPADAMQVVLNESGEMDFDRMGEMVGQTAEEVRSQLAEDKLVFKNAKGDAWVPANEYLTGNVVEKLREAEVAAQADPAYQGHVEALRDVQPPRVTAEEIRTPLGAPWIPAEMVNEWVKEEFRVPSSYRPGNGQYFRYLGETESFVGQNEKGNKATQGKFGGGGWTQAENFRSDYADITFGTDRMSAKNILLKTLQGSPIAVTEPGPDGKGRVPDEAGTMAAQKKAEEMQKAFDDWVWKDPDRRAQLEEKYNDTHNAIRPRVFDGSHQTFPEMSAKWQRQMRPHQRDAIYRVVADGTALLAHEVGFGKSATMIAAAKERKRLGLANKPVFVVPKATHEQFVGQFMEVYPGARILAPDADDFQKGNREAFLSRVATGDWDGVVLSYEQFERIPLSPETEMSWIEQQTRELQGLLSEVSSEGDRGAQTKTTLKQINKKLNNYTVRLQQLRDKLANRSDDTVNFEDLGIDQIYVDEADNYKNLPYVSKMASGRSGIKGLPQSEAQRAWDMYMKVRYLQEKSGQKPDGSFAKGGVVFATGTPVANTIAETYTMMRYLQPDELKRRGLDNFDAWAKTYGHVKSGMEYTAGGKYKTVQRFSRFVNLPELSTLFQRVADIRVASEVPEMMAAQPRLVSDSGDPRRTTVVSPSHPALEAYMENVVRRVDQLGNVGPEVDNMLKISSDARKAAMDVQMVWPNAPHNPEGKIPLAAENIAQIFKQEADRKGTQLVFLDLGTPKETVDRGAADDAKPEDDEDLTGEEQQLLTNVYERLRTELTRRDVPRDQVAFIHEYKTPAAKEEILDKVRRGDVRVLVGSTAKLGVGINVQDRAAAAHHIDVPWRPRDVEQREGRVIRQGNKAYGPEVDEEGNVIGPGRGVKIFQYVQQGSFDRFMWQAVEEKARGIKALMKRHQTHREMEDVDELVIGASEAKALASGNPLAIRVEELRQLVDMGRLSRAAHKRRQFEAETQKRGLQPRIDVYQKNLPALDKDADYVESLPEGEDFTIKVGNQIFDKRKDAGEALVETFGRVTREIRGQGYVPIGEYKGFTVALNTDQGYQLTLIHPDTRQPHQGSALESDEVTPRGLMSRVDNLVRGLPGRAAKTRANLERAEENVRLYDDQLARPFEDSEQLDYAERQLRVIRSRLADDTKLLQEGDDPKMDVDTDWIPDRSIATPAQAPVETPREIPDADPVNLREAVEIARSEEEADTPEEVVEALQDELQAERVETQAAPAEQVTIEESPELSESVDVVADVPSPEPAGDGPDSSDEKSPPDPDTQTPDEVKAPLSELDALAAEFKLGAYEDLDSTARLLILELYRNKAGLPKETRIAPDIPTAAEVEPEPQDPSVELDRSDAPGREPESESGADETAQDVPQAIQEDAPTEVADAPQDEPEPYMAEPTKNSELTNAAGAGPDDLTGDSPPVEPGPEPDPMESEPPAEPEPAPELAAAAVDVKAVTDDGVVTGAEAQEAADEATRSYQMAGQRTITKPLAYGCGHDQDTVIYTRARDQAKQVAYWTKRVAGEDCKDCKSDARKEQIARQVDTAAMGLSIEDLAPITEGSEKQIAWASNIRTEALGRMSEDWATITAGADIDAARQALTSVFANADARFWIDIGRGHHQVVDQLLDKYRAVEIARSEEEADTPEEVADALQDGSQTEMVETAHQVTEAPIDEPEPYMAEPTMDSELPDAAGAGPDDLTGDSPPFELRLEADPVETEPPAEPEPAPDLAAAAAEVKAVTDDGVVTGAEAQEAADEAARLMSAAAQETPDSPEPRLAYDSDGEIARLVMEMCDDPGEMRKVLARAKASRSDADREEKDHDGTQRVSDEVRSAAAKVMSRRSQDSQQADRLEGKPRPERQKRISDVDLLRRAADECKREGREDDVVKEIEEFLRSQRDAGKTSKILTGKYATVAEQTKQRRSAARRSRSGHRSSASDGLKKVNARPPTLRVVTR